jgi:hypothetical protein
MEGHRTDYKAATGFYQQVPTADFKHEMGRSDINANLWEIIYKGNNYTTD